MNTMQHLFKIVYCFLALSLTACSTNQHSITLYQELGGEEKVAEIVENFISEIEFNADIYHYFKDSDIGRFRDKLNEHLCFLTNGPCQYTGDSMVDVHTGMNMTERDFNLGVDLFINAMTKANVPHPVQNKVLNVMAKTRKEIIYL